MVSLVKSFAAQSVALHNEAQRDNAWRWTERVELLGNTSFGKIVRPEFGGASIAAGTLRPLTAFSY